MYPYIRMILGFLMFFMFLHFHKKKCYETNETVAPLWQQAIAALVCVLVVEPILLYFLYLVYQAFKPEKPKSTLYNRS